MRRFLACVGGLGTVMAMAWMPGVMPVAWAEEPAQGAFKRRSETHVRVGPDRRIGATELWQPLYQDMDRVLYASIRSMTDNTGNLEGNFGLGMRQFHGDHIWGQYAYLDRRASARGAYYWQTTLGGEYIRNGIEARANVYVPFSNSTHYLVADPGGPYMAGTGVYMRGPSTLVEEPQPGFDAEFGVRIPEFSEALGPTRVYASGYYFMGDETPDMLGARARLTADITSWLRLGARVQHDDVRGTQYFAEATLKMPAGPVEETQGLWARMADTPERDIDIITGDDVQLGDPVPFYHADTGQTVRVLTVDNRAAGTGDGSVERPYQTLAAALAAATPHDVIYVAKGDGTPNGYDAANPITTPDITITGAGSPLYFTNLEVDIAGQNWSGDVVLRGADDYPLITNTTGDALNIQASGITVRGLQFDAAAGSGVAIETGVNNTRFENVRLTGNDLYGLRISQAGTTDMTVTMRDSMISGNLLYGILADRSDTGALTLDLGTSADYGQNDIFGNITADLYTRTGGAIVNARGNYWGAGVAPSVVGPDQGVVDRAVAVSAPFCEDCVLSATAFGAVTDAVEGAQTISNAAEISGIRGHRYIQTYGDGTPSLLVNGVASGAIARVQSGDHVALAAAASTIGLTTRQVHVTGAGLNAAWSVGTRFAPNALGNLIGWWDASDLDGDFDTNDQPASGVTLASWGDKTGYGHWATATGTVRPTYDGATTGVATDGVDDRMNVAVSGYLAALNNGMSIAMVLAGEPGTGPSQNLFSYGNCTGAASSRCAAIEQSGTGGDVSLRVDTSAARGQTPATFSLLDGNVHLVWLGLGADGTITLRRDGDDIGTSSYNPGGSFANAQGLGLLGAMNGVYHEMLLFNGTVDNTDRDLVEAYLTSKWGL